MRDRIFIWILLLPALLRAQQTPSFTQFVLNQYALNPAVAGTNIGLEGTVGSRQQWIGMPNAPATNFGSVTYGWRKNFSYRGHHGVGFYAEDDRQGMFSSKAAYISYAYHLRIFTGVHIGAGFFAGIRRMGINQLLYDYTDPALSMQKTYGLLYPDIIPGLRVYTRKLFFDVSARQLYVNRIKQGSFQIGSLGTHLDPTILFSVKRKFILNDYNWTVVPAAMMQYSVHNAPFIQANCMVFYRKRIGVGASVRGKAFASAILQIKIVKNVIAGIAYDYPTNSLRAAGANSFEIVLNFSPGSADEDGNRPRINVAQCPDFDF
jgi:type IX secretion system PorP/SprF family membrane protein